MNLFVRLPCCFFLAWSLLACSLKTSNLEELAGLCEKDAGVKIYRSVDAKGYYDGEKRAGSLEVLLHSNFDFIEFCDDNPILKTILQEPGCARYIRVPVESGSCDPKVQHILENSFGEPYESFRKGYCVELELIKEPAARYFYQSSRDVWMGSDGVAKFKRSRVWITDTDSSELMGEYITYALKPRPSSTIYKYCSNIDERYPSFTDTDLVNRVLSLSKN